MKREQFEQHIRDTSTAIGSNTFKRNPDGTYQLTSVRELYGVWEAALEVFDEDLNALHRRLAAETLRADQGWSRYESANKERIELQKQLANSERVPFWRQFSEEPPEDGAHILWRLPTHADQIGIGWYVSPKTQLNGQVNGFQSLNSNHL